MAEKKCRSVTEQIGLQIKEPWTAFLEEKYDLICTYPIQLEIGFFSKHELCAPNEYHGGKKAFFLFGE